MREIKRYRCEKWIYTRDCMGYCYKNLVMEIDAPTKTEARKIFKRKKGLFPKTVELISD